MPDLILNCAFITRSTGTDDPVFSAVTGKNRDPRNALVDGQEVFYYRRYRGTKSGFEHSIGNWVAATGSISRTSTESSSAENEVDPISWTSAPQLISVTENVSMIESLPATDLDVVELDGTEAVFLIKDGDGGQTTAQDISGTPFRQKAALSGNRIREYSDFTKIRSAFASTTGGTLDLEPYKVTQTGTAKAAQLSASAVYRPGLELITGTDTNGTVQVDHLWAPMTFAQGASNFDHRVEVEIPVLSATGQVFEFRTGFEFNDTQGMFFRHDSGSANWYAFVQNSVGFGVDTTIPVVAATKYTLRVWYDPDASATKFYINGALVTTILDTSKAVAVFTTLASYFQLKKLTGTTSRSVNITRHSIDLLGLEAPHF